VNIPESELAAVLDFLRELGASDEQLREAAASDSPARLALDLVLARSFVLSARQVAERVDLPVETVVEIVGNMGFIIDDLDAPRFSEDDVELVALTHQIGHGLSHVLASAIGRIADAGVSSYVTEVDPRLSPTAVKNTAGSGLRTMFENFRIRFGYADTSMDELSIARANATAGELARRAAGTLGSAFIHALREAVRWQRVAQEGTTDRSLQRVAVGFVDLVGFTSMSREITVEALTDLVLNFESTAFSLATKAGGRVIKHVGDEVMFVALDAATGARIAAGIVETFCDQGICPRGGVAHGEVLAVHGDYYGSVVNLASRLTEEAVPGEVLVDASTAASIGAVGGFVESAGRRMLKGFDEPVMVFSYVTVDTDIADAVRSHPAGAGR